MFQPATLNFAKSHDAVSLFSGLKWSAGPTAEAGGCPQSPTVSACAQSTRDVPVLPWSRPAALRPPAPTLIRARVENRNRYQQCPMTWAAVRRSGDDDTALAALDTSGVLTAPKIRRYSADARAPSKDAARCRCRIVSTGCGSPGRRWKHTPCLMEWCFVLWSAAPRSCGGLPGLGGDWKRLRHPAL